MYIRTIHKLCSSILFNSQVFCIGILIPSAVTIPAINSVEESLEQRRNASREYENAGSYRSIAIYLVWISSLAMVLHIMMIIVRIFYLTMVMKKLFRIYVILVSE